MSPTMDQPRRIRTKAERPRPTGRRRAATTTPDADTAGTPTTAAPTAPVPTTRAAARAAERAAERERAHAPATEPTSTPTVPTTPASEEPATAVIPVIAARAAAPARETTRVETPGIEVRRNETRRAVRRGSTAASAPAMALGREPQAVLQKAASVKHMSQRMAVVAGALGLALTAGGLGQALGMPFFGQETPSHEAAGAGQDDARQSPSAAPAPRASYVTAASPSASSHAGQPATVPEAPAAVSPSSVPTPHVSLAAPVWIPSAQAAAANPAPAAAAPAQPSPAPTQPAPAPGDVPSDTITTPPAPTVAPTPTTPPTPTVAPTPTPTPTPTGTQTPKPRPSGKPSTESAPVAPQGSLQSLLEAAKKTTG